MLKYLIKLMRPHQWYKNFVVFIAIIFSGNLFNTLLLEKSILAFVVLCMLSGFVYIVNDIVDIEKDKKHPVKRNRPLPSGHLSKSAALFFSIIILLVGLYISLSISQMFFLGGLTFVFIGLLYSLVLKNVFLVDVLTVSVNFVLRAVLGAFAINVAVSEWLILCTFLLAFFLALCKRKSELDLLGKNAYKHRAVLRHYTADMLNNFIIFTLSSLFISYAIYTIFVTNYYTTATLPVSLYLLFRYFSFGYDKKKKAILGSPSKALKDKGMLIGIITWVLLIVFIFYFL
ncbi:MAG: decaprenyl-phosphate phosphoribosyltransferase [Candidatus Aenigmarchaeota archaeon]|nr:decaprenyl-phosphate phosphoribosyltransferase [Candidatus Aenigmarchaeota archaeon]